MARKITIEPVTRVEGHGKITVKLDDNDQVIQTRLHIVEFRGFERFVQGRTYWEAPVLVQRLCGICPVSHHLAASKAMDHVVGMASANVTPTADKTRRLMHYGQILQSHVVHFFYLACPDLLFGVDSDPLNRNISGVIQAFPELAKKAVLMRKFGQEVIRLTAGKRIHGTGSIPGGINKHLTKPEGDSLLKGTPDLNVELIIQWAQEGVALFKDYHRKNAKFIDTFAAFPSNYMSLVRPDGAMDLYHGVLRAVDHEGGNIFDQVDYQDYAKHIAEEIEPWTYMKFPYFRVLGREKGWYRVGPLARLNTCDFIPTPLAQTEFEEYRAYSHDKFGGKITNSTMHTHWARLIEALHAAEIIRDLLNDPDLYDGDLVRTGKHTGSGVGVIEAPRGTLFHQYEVNEDDIITKCTLLVSTTSNNEGMNRSVGWVADNLISGKREIPESILNQVEVALRAYDPCLSCATHAVGQMPLEVILYDSKNLLVGRRTKNGLRELSI